MIKEISIDLSGFNRKIAVLLLCHRFPKQINNFIDCFDHDRFDIFIHVDAKSDIQPLIHKNENVYFLPDDKRISIVWGSYSMVEATLNLIKYAYRFYKYEYYWLCSGQDYLIINSERIYDLLMKNESNYISIVASRNNPQVGLVNKGLDKRCEVFFPSWMIGRKLWQRIILRLYLIITGGIKHTFGVIRRKTPCGFKVYFGSQWWCLNHRFIKWIINFLNNYPEYELFYKSTVCSDESFFQTLIMNSPYNKNINDELLYVKWKGKGSPETLKNEDYDDIVKSNKVIVRKIDAEQYPSFYRKIQVLSKKDF